MTRFAGTLVALTLLPATLLAAEDKADAQKVIAKGIKFLGGAKNLKKFKNATFREKGTYYGMGDGLPYTGEYAISRPDKFRMVIKNVFTQVINGDKGWVKQGDKVSAMPAQQVKYLKGQLYVTQVTQLLPLRNGKRFKLSIAGKGKIGDKAVTIVKVASKGHPDMKLSFANDSGALLRAEYKAHKEGTTDGMWQYVDHYLSYGTSEGVKYPSKFKTTRDGKIFIESSITSYKSMKKVDESLFAKPK